MYLNNNLDAPPPISRFRRPWSPDSNDPFPVIHNVPQHNINANDDYWDPRPAEHPQYHRRRREPSDVSVEALDLADYAMTLRAQQRTADRYPPFPSQEAHTPTSPPIPPRRLASPDALHPPSLISRGGTQSTQSHAYYSASRTSHASPRPFSLPPPPRPIAYPERSLDSPHIVHSSSLPHAEPEIDVSQFPSWSRGWYDSSNTKKLSPHAQDDCPPFLMSTVNNLNYSPFAPGYMSYGNTPSSNEHSFPGYSSHASTRDLSPWSNGPPDNRLVIDPETKEERMRMLQREFGARATGRDDYPNDDGEGDRMIGSVDAKGRLITQGPKKRMAFRVLQLILALAAAIPSIYAAVIIKSQGTPPPAAKPAAYLLYILSVITTITLSYLVIIYPCRGGRKSVSAGPLANGMMVLPVQGLPGGKKKTGRKKGQNSGQGGPAGDLQVNLIVDPNVFGRSGGSTQDDESDDSTVDDFGNSSMPGGYGSHHQTRQRRRPRRRSVFRGLAMEAQWKAARSSLWRIFFFDLAGIALWGVEFIYILIGKRCPSGAFNGWCNAYNVSSAAACLLCVAFGFSTFFDIKDLHASNMSPRTRT